MVEVLFAAAVLIGPGGTRSLNRIPPVMDDEVTDALGRYIGRLILEPLSDGRLMRVVEPFGFVNADDVRWPVPAGAKIDGASVPQVLWSIMGTVIRGPRSAAPQPQYRALAQGRHRVASRNTPPS
jgi:hypothetical protein